MLKNILFIFLFISSLNAISLKELLNSVEVSNENYQAQEALQQMAKKRYESASKDNFPTLNLIGAYENNSKPYQESPKNIALAELRASYIIYDGNRINNNELAKKSLYKSQEFKTEYLKQELMLNVIQEYFIYQNSKFAIDVLEYKIDELDEQIKKLEILVKNDLATKDKLQALVASKKEALYDIETLKIDLEKSLLQLSLLTGLENLPNDNNGLVEPNNKEIYRADIEAKKLQAQSLKYSSENFNYLPTISLNNSLKRQEFIDYDLIDDNKLNNQLTLQISIPIFDAGKIQKDKEASKLEV